MLPNRGLLALASEVLWALVPRAVAHVVLVLAVSSIAVESSVLSMDDCLPANTLFIFILSLKDCLGDAFP